VVKIKKIYIVLFWLNKIQQCVTAMCNRSFTWRELRALQTRTKCM